jgi:hypothetical protein
MANAENERPAATFGLDWCTSNGQEIVSTPIITLALIVKARVFVKCSVLFGHDHALVAFPAQKVFRICW